MSKTADAQIEEQQRDEAARCLFQLIEMKGRCGVADDGKYWFAYTNEVSGGYSSAVDLPTAIKSAYEHWKKKQPIEDAAKVQRMNECRAYVCAEYGSDVLADVMRNAG